MLIAYLQAGPLYIIEEDDEANMATSWHEMLIHMEHAACAMAPGRRNGHRQITPPGEEDNVKDVLLTSRQALREAHPLTKQMLNTENDYKAYPPTNRKQEHRLAPSILLQVLPHP